MDDKKIIGAIVSNAATDTLFDKKNYLELIGEQALIEQYRSVFEKGYSADDVKVSMDKKTGDVVATMDIPRDVYDRIVNANNMSVGFDIVDESGN